MLEKDILLSIVSKKFVLVFEKNGELMEKNNFIYFKLNNLCLKEDDVGIKGLMSIILYFRNISNFLLLLKEREVL